MSKSKISRFLGKQISRQNRMKDYALIILNLISVISLLKLAFNFPSEYMLFLLPCAYLLLLILGYLFDRANIFTEDARQTININYRRYNLENLKQHQFLIMSYKFLIRALRDNTISADELETEYEAYLRKWGFFV